MRYLVFGDVHGNVLALDAVLKAGQERGAETYLFVGDVVGYGPNPVECIERLMPLAECGSLAWVAGNHELAFRGDVEMEGYSAEAVQTLMWGRKLVADKPWAREFIESAYLTTCVNDLVWLTHDSLANPSSGGYHRWPQHAKSELACLHYNKGRVCFYGHTHAMRAELSRVDRPVMLVPMEAHGGAGIDPHPIRLSREDLGWIGTGSVGFPTNPERRADYLILDTADDKEWRVEKYVADYSRDEARARIVTILGPVCEKGVAERISRWL